MGRATTTLASTALLLVAACGCSKEHAAAGSPAGVAALQGEQAQDRVASRGPQGQGFPGRGPHASHTIEVPGHPSVVLSTDELLGKKPPLPWRPSQLQSCILVRLKEANAFATKTHGNGVLLNAKWFLTNKHVADYFRKAPEKYSLMAFYADGRSYEPSFVGGAGSVVNVDEDESVDLALVRVAGIQEDPNNPQYPTIGDSTPQLKASVYAYATHGLGDRPNMDTGIVATAATKRATRAGTQLVLGASVASFGGQSGSPVYLPDGDGDSVKLVALVVGGWVEWAPTGEALRKAPESEVQWDRWPDWTWCVPLASFKQRINDLVSK